MIQQITRTTRMARKTTAPSAGMPTSATRAAGSAPAAARPAYFSMFFTARVAGNR
jgi:hypothetical protein